MRTVVHLSDVHFGQTEPETVSRLSAAVRAAAPSLVAISGDLTQRARRREFRQAREFLAGLPVPQIVVPGNHDIPLHNVWSRFLGSLERYCKYITADLEPFYEDAEIAVLGVNTARSLTIKGGRINRGQMAVVEQRFRSAKAQTVKILVSHHPFDLPSDQPARRLAGRAREAMARFASCGIDLLLAGHFHQSYCGPTAVRYAIDGHSAVFAQAGTACSMRERGEANSFNIIRIEGKSMEVQVMSSGGSSGFQAGPCARFRRAAGEWTLA